VVLLPSNSWERFFFREFSEAKIARLILSLLVFSSYKELVVIKKKNMFLKNGVRPLYGNLLK